MKKGLLIVGGVIVLLFFYVLSAYNGLVTLNEEVTNQWAQVETQYQRRVDLIPNLVASVKGIMTQEQKVFGDLANARARYSGATTANDKALAANEVEGSLSRLLVVMENYPQLKSSENVQTLMAQLEGTENRISVERKRYNDAAKEFNVKIKRFPSNVIAGAFGFDLRNYFEADKGAENAPKVDLQLK